MGQKQKPSGNPPPTVVTTSRKRKADALKEEVKIGDELMRQYETTLKILARS